MTEMIIATDPNLPGTSRLTGRSYYYVLDENDRPVPTNDVRVWADFFERDPRRFIRKTVLGVDRGVSSVFLGMDHGFHPDPYAVPILYETLVFGGPCDGHMERHATRGETIEAHERIVKRLEGGVVDWRGLVDD